MAPRNQQHAQAEQQQVKTALITGASSGIGKAIALKFARQGIHVILVARREDRLEELADEIRDKGGFASVYSADLANEGERLSLFEDLVSDGQTIDILVNNAGFGWYGYFSEMDWQTTREMIRVNMVAAAHLTHLFLPQMKERGYGHIINISSIAGDIPAQGIAMYGASKAFLNAFTSSLHRELVRTGVHASAIRPGPVKTAFFDAAESHPNGSRVPAEWLGVRVETVADCAWRLLRDPRRVAYVPWWLRLVPWVELTFGWLQDLVGPIGLQWIARKNK